MRPSRRPATSSASLVGAVQQKSVRPSSPPRAQAKQGWLVTTRSRTPPTLADAQAFGCERVRHPDRALGVGADAVGEAPLERRPLPAVTQPAVVTDVEGAEAPRERLGDDEGGADERHPVGEAHLRGRHVDGALRIDAQEPGQGRCDTPPEELLEVEAELADEGGAVLEDEHVVGVTGTTERAEIRVARRLAARALAHDHVVGHGDGEEVVCGEPSEP